MSDSMDRQRVRPTVDGRSRLLADLNVAGQPHVVDAGALGEYAEVVAVHGQGHADTAFPEVSAHLMSGCRACAADLDELVALVSEPELGSQGDLTPQPSGQGDLTPQPLEPGYLTPHPPLRRGEGEHGRPPDDSGIYAVDLPDAREAEEAEHARLQRLRRVRDWLLVVSAAAILLIGLSLVGLAYVASQQPGARLGLTPLPVPGAVPVPGQLRAAPDGMACPSSHPIKGNRASSIYHVPGGGFYEQTRPEDCFASPADAETAGYRRSQR